MPLHRPAAGPAASPAGSPAAPPGGSGGPAGSRERIEELRERIRHIERRPPRRTAFEASGIEAVDGLLPGGGFPRGALSEIQGEPGSGKTALCLSTMARSMRSDGLAAFVDGRGELYPPAAAALGVDLARFLLVRPPASITAQGIATVLWSAEVLLGSGAFEVVALDLPLLRAVRPEGRAAVPPEVMVRRLVAAAEKGGAVGLWLSAREGEGAGGLRLPAAVRLEVRREPEGPRIRRIFARGAEVGHGA
ncbi:MAG: hypothetical protein HZB56_00895 [Deltaproteobacteria bacterium]|nr:hypothetical protein [Deltaproteobacteria bacterium]